MEELAVMNDNDLTPFCPCCGQRDAIVKTQPAATSIIDGYNFGDLPDLDQYTCVRDDFQFYMECVDGDNAAADLRAIELLKGMDDV